MLAALSLALFIPLIGFLFLSLFAYQMHRSFTHWIGCGSILIAFSAFSWIVYTFEATSMPPQNFLLYQWIHIEQIHANFSLHLDSLSLLMSLIITGIGFLIHLYSIGYMDHEQDYSRYFACLNFFVFSMLLLVLADNLLLLFVGWEGVGLASYLLIGFWYERSSAIQAAMKAFVMNRIGDLGLLLGILLTFQLFGTTSISEISTLSPEISSQLIVGLTLLYFIGAIGKSAQLPLYTWLPDAMEGPTPVSALIHAATMVTAGVYLIARLHSVFLLAPTTLLIVGIIGGVTSLFAAICAVGQIDLKRVLAYSTVSQLGLMFLACGVGAFYAAMFHLTTHAFIKALLFLSAGNVVHMTGGNTDMSKMGGLERKLPLTKWLFLIGVLALSGIPPLAAFFSKDLILEEEYLSHQIILFIIGLFACILTAFYLTRAYLLTFAGEPRLERKEFEKIQEAPSIMIAPLIVLAVLSIFGGFLGYNFWQDSILEHFLDHSQIESLNEVSLLTFTTFLSAGGAILAIGLAFILYMRHLNRLTSTSTLLMKSFFINEIYDRFIVKPFKMTSKVIVNWLEPFVFDDFMRIVSEGTQKIANRLQDLQSGQIRSYIAWMLVGSALLIGYVVFAGTFHV